MPALRSTVLIRAEPAAVFDLISRVEEFSRYSDMIEAVRMIGPDTYRWTTGIAGVALEWDSIITEAKPAARLAWRSIRGVENCGAFSLSPVAAGTRVDFTMSYHLRSRIMEKLLEGTIAAIGENVADDILVRIRRQLETAGRATAA
jgi:uncharacterized membrane protein